MGLNRMLILLAAGFAGVVALGVLVAVLDVGPGTEELQKRGSVVFPYIDEKNLTLCDVAAKLEIDRGKGKVVVEKLGEQSWRLRQPVDARADRSTVLSILNGLKNLKIETDPIEVDSPEGFAQYGLTEPRSTVIFWLGSESRRFFVGSEVEVKKGQKSAYIRLADEDRVLVVANDVIEKLNKEPAAFRDKRVFDRDRDVEKALALSIRSAKGPMELELAEKAWRLKSPVADLADPLKVAGSSGLLSKVKNLEAEKYITEDASKPAQYGLDKPQLTCEVKVEDGPPTKLHSMKLRIGRETDEKKEQFYAKREDEPSIFTIKKDFLADIEPKIDDLRERKVADVKADDVTRVEITCPKASWSVGRKSKGDDWNLSHPKAAKAERDAVNGFVEKLGRLRVARWVDDPKDPANNLMEKPEAAITLAREPKDKPGAKAQPPIKLYVSGPVKKEKETPKEPEKEKPKEPEKGKEPEKEKGKEAGKEKPKEKEFEEGRYVRREGQTCLLFVPTSPAPVSATTEEKDSVEALTALVQSLEKGHLALLDRTVFDFKDGDVVRLTIERGAAKAVCEKKGDAWKLTSPVQLDADKSSISKILGAMSHLKAKGYIAENPDPQKLQSYGLDKPLLRLTAAIEEEEKRKDDKNKAEEKKEAKKNSYTKTLLLSRKVDGETYGKAQDGTLVFTVDSGEVSRLIEEPISTTLGDFAGGDATSVTIAPRGKPEVVVEKEKDNDTWRLTKPKQADADQAVVKKVIDALQDLKGIRCLDYGATKNAGAYGLEPPEAVVTVKIKDKSDLVVKFGKPVPDEKDDPGSYAQKGDSNQAFLVAKGKVDDIVKSLADLEKKPEPKKEERKKEEGKAPEKKGNDAKEPEKQAPLEKKSSEK
jgi:hypothetical protein